MTIDARKETNEETSINSKRIVQDKRHDCSILMDLTVNIMSTVIIL